MVSSWAVLSESSKSFVPAGQGSGPRSFSTRRNLTPIASGPRAGRLLEQGRNIPSQVESNGYPLRRIANSFFPSVVLRGASWAVLSESSKPPVPARAVRDRAASCPPPKPASGGHSESRPSADKTPPDGRPPVTRGVSTSEQPEISNVPFSSPPAPSAPSGAGVKKGVGSNPVRYTVCCGWAGGGLIGS
jgi:hypothetical protein